MASVFHSLEQILCGEVSPGASRESVAKHLQEQAKPAEAPIGSEHPADDSKPAKAPIGSRCLCAEFHELILAKLEQGLSAQRIFHL